MDNFEPHVDVGYPQTFFRAQPVDGISAGWQGLPRRPFREIPSGIPSLHTGVAACLHNLSTALCTARFDVFGRADETVRAIR